MNPSKFSTRMAAVLAIAFLLTCVQALIAQSKPSNGDPIQATWRVSVTQRNCQTGQALGDPFPSLLTFNQGGTLNESTANPKFYPNLRLPGEGYWTTSGNGVYQASSIAFITADGQLAMTQRIDQKILLLGDKLTANATVQFFDPSGKLLMSGCATAVAVRYK